MPRETGDHAEATPGARTPWRLWACGMSRPRLERGDTVQSPPGSHQSMPKGAVQPWFTKTDDEPTSLTSVGSDAGSPEPIRSKTAIFTKHSCQNKKRPSRTVAVIGCHLLYFM